MKNTLIAITLLISLTSSLHADDPDKTALLNAVRAKDYSAASIALGQDAGSVTTTNTLDMIFMYLRSIEHYSDLETDKDIDWLFSLLPEGTGDMINTFRGDVNESTVLHKASLYFYTYAIQKDLDHGASPFVRDEEGQTPYDYLYNGWYPMVVQEKSPEIKKNDASAFEEIKKCKANLEVAMGIMTAAIKKIELEALKDPTTALFFYAERLNFDGIQKALDDGANVNATLKDINTSSLYKHLALANHEDADNALTIVIRNTYIQPTPYQQTSAVKKENGIKIIKLLTKNNALATMATDNVVKEIKKEEDKETVLSTLEENKTAAATTSKEAEDETKTAAETETKLVKAVNSENYIAAALAIGKEAAITQQMTLKIMFTYLDDIGSNQDETTNKGIDWLFSFLPKDAGDLLNTFRGDAQQNTLLHKVSMKYYTYAIQKMLDYGASPFVREYDTQIPYDMIYNGWVATLTDESQKFIKSNPARLERTQKGRAKVKVAMDVMSAAIKKIELEALKDMTTSLFFYADRVDLDGIKKALDNGANINASLKDIKTSSLYKHLTLSNHNDADTPLTLLIRNSFIQPQQYQKKPKEIAAEGTTAVEFLVEKGALSTDATTNVIKEIKSVYDRDKLSTVIEKTASTTEGKKVLEQGLSIYDEKKINSVISYLEQVKDDPKKATVIMGFLDNFSSSINTDQKDKISKTGSISGGSFIKAEDVTFNEAEFREKGLEFLKEAKPDAKKLPSTATTEFIAQASLTVMAKIFNEDKDYDGPALTALVAGKNGILDYLYQTASTFKEGSTVRNAYSSSLYILKSFSQAFRYDAMNAGYVDAGYFDIRKEEINSYLKKEAITNVELNILVKEGAPDMKDLKETVAPFEVKGLY